MKQHLKLFLLSIVIVLSNFMFGFTKKTVNATSSTATNNTTAIVNATAPKVALILGHSGISAKYNIDINDGLEELLRSGKISELTHFAPNAEQSNDDAIPEIINFINNGYGIIVIHSISIFDKVLEIARVHPNTKFVLIDPNYEIANKNDNSNYNVYLVRFSQYQAGFLAGAFAGLVVSKHLNSLTVLQGSGNVGVIKGSNDSSFTNIMADGFTSGVEYTCSGCNVITEVTSSYTANSASFASANRLYNDKKVDIIFALAGGASIGILRAAEDNGKYVIGSDRDMFDDSDTVLTSAFKSFSTAVNMSLSSIIDSSSPSKHEYVFNIANQGVGLTPFHSYDEKIPQDIKDKLDEIKKDIESGDIISID